jgi:hypothetical protein
MAGNTDLLPRVHGLVRPPSAASCEVCVECRQGGGEGRRLVPDGLRRWQALADRPRTQQSHLPMDRGDAADAGQGGLARAQGRLRECAFRPGRVRRVALPLVARVSRLARPGDFQSADRPLDRALGALCRPAAPDVPPCGDVRLRRPLLRRIRGLAALPLARRPVSLWGPSPSGYRERLWPVANLRAMECPAARGRRHGAETQLGMVLRGRLRGRLRPLAKRRRSDSSCGGRGCWRRARGIAHGSLGAGRDRVGSGPAAVEGLGDGSTFRRTWNRSFG